MTRNNKHLSSYSFCGSEIREWLSWFYLKFSQGIVVKKDVSQDRTESLARAEGCSLERIRSQDADYCQGPSLLPSVGLPCAVQEGKQNR